MELFFFCLLLAGLPFAIVLLLGEIGMKQQIKDIARRYIEEDKEYAKYFYKCKEENKYPKPRMPRCEIRANGPYGFPMSSVAMETVIKSEEITEEVKMFLYPWHYDDEETKKIWPRTMKFYLPLTKRP